MKKITHLLFFSSLLPLSLIYSCGSDDLIVPDGEIIIVSGNNMTGIAGEYIMDPVTIRVGSQLPAESLVVEGSNEDGGFVVTDNFDLSTRNNVLDENYESRIYLSLGCDIGSQTFNINIRDISCYGDPDCPILASTQVTANAEQSSTEWSRVCNIGDVLTMKKHNGTIYSITGLFPSGWGGVNPELNMSTDFKNWTSVHEFENGIKHFDILSDGTFIALTNDGLMTSIDGVSWENKDVGLPFSDETLVASQLLAEDSVLFVGFYEDVSYLLFRSRDLGESWEYIESPIDNSPISRSTNGTLYAKSSDFSNEIYQSANSGNSWELVSYTGTMDGIIQDIEVSDNNEIFIVTGQANITDFTVSTKLYKLNTVTQELTEVLTEEENLIVLNIYNYQGVIYLLGGFNTIFVYDGSWQKIEGPQTTYPNIEGRFFAVSISNFLFVNNPGEYLLGTGRAYSNFLD